LYRLGANGYWRTVTQSGFSVYKNPSGTTNRLMYNQLTGGSWQLTEVGEGNYVLCHVFVTTGKVKQVYAIMGQNEYTNTVNARNGVQTEISSLLLGSLPAPEIRPIASVIFQTDKDYANTINARVIEAVSGGDDYVDWRTNDLPRGTTPADHGSLTGLSDDDHTQYLLINGTRDMTGNLNMGGYAIGTVGNVDGVDISVLKSDYDTHVGSTSIHFLQTAIDHTNLINKGTNTHSVIDTHIASSAIHYTVPNIDHTLISNVGTNTHTLIDTHIGSASIHFIKSSIDHTGIINVGTNTHSAIDTHISSTSIHLGTASISHLEIQDIGTNTHDDIDTHIGSASIHYIKSSIDHTGIQNIGTNTHSAIDTHIGSASIHFPVVWGDGLSYSNPNASIDYNSTNLKITTNQIDTIQSIATVASPTFAGAKIGGFIKRKTNILPFSIINPSGAFAVTPRINIMKAPAPLTITKLTVQTSTTGYEVVGDLKKANSFITYAGSAVINDFDTTTGYRTDSSLTAGTVHTDRVIFLSFDSTPNAGMTQVHYQLEWDYDD
jgi:hypothetical protein